MTVFSKPTYETLLASLKSLWRSNRPEVDTSDMSDVDIDSRGIAHIGDGLHDHIVSNLKNIFPITSAGKVLADWLYSLGQPDGNGGYGLLQPATSSGTSALQVTCSSGTPTINTSHQLVHANGDLFQVNETYVFTGPGTANVDIVSIDTGYRTNLEIGEELTFVNPPAGIDSGAEIVVDLDGGRDLQTETEGRAAALEYLRAPNMSGNWPEWKRLIEAALPGILDVFVYFGRNNYPFGYGTTDIAILQKNESGVNRVVTSAQETAVYNYFVDNAPYLLLQQLRLLAQGGLSAPFTGTVTPVEKTIELEYELASGSPSSKRCSWDAQSEKRYIAAETPGSYLIEVNSAYTIGPQAGETVFINGLEATVVLEPGNASVPVSSSMSKFTVDAWPWTNNLASGRPSGGGFYVMSGGGIISIIWQAVKDYIDSIGPAKGATAAPQVDWDDTLRINSLQYVSALAAEGYIVDFPLTKIDGGTINVEPNYTVTSIVELLIDDGVVVWEVK